MSIDLTAAPQTDPLQAYRYRDGLYAVDLITAALQLDFFTWLAAHPSSLSQIATHFGFQERPLDVMLTLFASNGWVTESASTFTATPQAREHFSSDSEWSLLPYYASLHDRPIARDFLEVLKTDKPAGWSGDKAAFDWHKAMEQEDFARKFTAAMDCRGRLLAQSLANKLDLTGRTSLLDIGGGSGIYACSIAARLIEERNSAPRVTVATGNMFEGLPTGHDVHLFSNVLHDWGIPEVQKLLAASHAALPPGGLLVIHDAIINAEKNGPLHVAEYSCLLMHSTQGKCYSIGEYATLMEASGFTPGPYQDTTVARGFITGLRV